MRKSVTGIITLVQEGRFTLVDEEGRTELFVLSYGAPVEAEDLQRLEHARIPVMVSYSDSKSLIAKVAHYVRPLTEAERRDHPVARAAEWQDLREPVQ